MVLRERLLVEKSKKKREFEEYERGWNSVRGGGRFVGTLLRHVAAFGSSTPNWQSIKPGIIPSSGLDHEIRLEIPFENLKLINQLEISDCGWYGNSERKSIIYLMFASTISIDFFNKRFKYD